MKILAFTLSILLSGPIWAANPHLRFALPDYANFQESLMVMTAYGIPLKPIEKDKKELTVVPAYVDADSFFSVIPQGGDSINSINTSGSGQTIEQTENEGIGGGIILNWFHGMGKNWGYSVTASHLRLSGDTLAWVEYNSSGAFREKVFAQESGHATQVMANLVYDPLYDAKNFGFPVFVGAGLYYSSQEATLSRLVDVANLSGVTVNYSSELDNLTYGFSLGFSFRIKTGDFNWNLFAMALIAPDSPTYEVNATRADNGSALLSNFTPPVETDTIFPSGGASISYEPWDISFAWIPNFFNVFSGDEGPHFTEETSQSIFTLSKTWTWK